VYFLLDWAVETDREQIGRRMQEMAGNVRTRNIAAIFSHISEDFRRGKENFRRLAESHIQRGDVDSVVVWDLQFPDEFRTPVEVSGRRAEGAQVFFRVNTHGGISEGWQARVEALFVRDPDGQWRLLDFRLFDPLTNQPLSIPGL
jgi:ketosteroid isomerase-like protein